jgi:hypothetical protein
MKQWKNYIKGTFTIQQQSIVLNGTYCDSTFTALTTSPCLMVQPIGSFTDTLAITFVNNHKFSFMNRFGTTSVLEKE